MKLSLAIPDFLMLALALQGFILSGILLYSSRKIKSNSWISLFIFCVSAEALMPITETLKLFYTYPILNYILFPTNIALGPLIYFYTRSLIFGNEQLPRNKFLYFLPMLLGMKHQIIFLLYSIGALSIPFIQEFYFRPGIQNLLFNYTNRFIFISMLSLVTYIAISYRLIIKNKVDNEASTFKLSDIQWLKKLLLVLVGLFILWLAAILLKNALRITWDYYLVFIPAIIFIHWLGLKAYLRQSMAQTDIEFYNKPAIKIYFSDEEIVRYSNAITQLMTLDKLYLDPLLKLEDVATKLQLPVKHVSHLLNQHIGKNFNDLINSYRVEEVKIRLSNPSFNQFTIAAIAFDCGFNSLATFQRCFKQFTGFTPSQYQNTLKIAIAPNK